LLLKQLFRDASNNCALLFSVAGGFFLLTALSDQR